MDFSKNTQLHPEICQVHFAPLSALHNILSGHQPDHVFPVLNALWEKLYHTPGTLSYSENQQLRDQGSVYSYSLNLRYPGLKLLDPHTLAQLDRSRWLILLEHRGGGVRLLGNHHQACVLTWSFSSDRKGFILSWEMSDSEPASWYEHIDQFYINANQELIQLYGDANTYTLNGDKEFIMAGPQSSFYKYDQGQLTSEEL